MSETMKTKTVEANAQNLVTDFNSFFLPESDVSGPGLPKNLESPVYHFQIRLF